MMKYPAFISILLMAFSISAHAQELTGIWLTQDKSAKLEIYQAPDGTYEGKVVWTSAKTEQAQKSIGSKVLTNFKKKGENTYSDGKIYNAQEDKTYSGTITLQDSQNLDIRGYIGVPLLGKTQRWTRSQQ